MLFLAGEVSSQESFPPREFGPCYRPMLFKAHVMPRILVCIHAKVNIYFVTLQTRRKCFYYSLSPTGHLGLQARLRSIPLSTIHIPHSTFHIPHSTFHIPRLCTRKWPLDLPSSTPKRIFICTYRSHTRKNDMYSELVLK